MNSNNRPKLLITGITGLLGRELLNSLSASEFAITGLSRREPDGRGQDKYHHFQGDLEQPQSLDSLEDQDLVLHLAALTHARTHAEYHRVNVQGTENLLEKCRERNVRHFIYCSSRTAVAGAGAYGETKLQAEEIVKSSGIPSTILKISEVYGRQTQGLNLLKNSIEGSFVLIPGSGRYELCPVHIEDLIQVLITTLALRHPRDRSYLIAGPEAISYKELVRILMVHRGVERKMFHVPIILIRMAAFLNSFARTPALFADQIDRLISNKPNDIRRAREELNFNPRSIRRNPAEAY